MYKNVDIFPSPYELAMEIAGKMAQMIRSSASKNNVFTVALSGGSTPELLFNLLSDNYAESVPWKYVHIFWGDERCVPPDNSESNFGMTKRTLLRRILLPSTNIHRIKGENDPDVEVERYSQEISAFTRTRGGYPLFDLVLLGLGEDGHTASIFPGNLGLFDSDRLCDAVYHPVYPSKKDNSYRESH